MYRQIFIPTEKAHSIDLPKEMYGVSVEVIAFPVQDEHLPLAVSQKLDARMFYNSIRLDLSRFTFDRNEANKR